MCGIFGIVFRDGTRVPDEEQLRASARLIDHRGPDDSGVVSFPGVGLAHTRLSLLDLSERSNQPFWDEDRRYCLVYNGEIYNFQELREELEARGATFRTTSDTEVLLQALMRDGVESTLRRAEGMFSFALFDTRERTLLLARDRFGIKPLMVYEDDDKLIFSSEVKAMMPWVSLRPNSAQMIRFLMNFGASVRNSCFYESVDIVPAGSSVTVKVGERSRRQSYFPLTDMFDPALSAELEMLTPEQAVDRVDELMQRSVNRMLVADAPVGALCSGGVDSSLLMAIAARTHGNLAIFHANVVGPSSEFDAASELARHLKLDLLSVETRDQDFIDLTPEVLYHYELPFFGHPHSVPFMMVSNLVRDSKVKAVLTGEGSDECFLGYDYLALEPFWRRVDRTVAGIAGLAQRIPVIGPRLWQNDAAPLRMVGDMLGQFEHALDERSNRDAFRERMGSEPGIDIRTIDMLGNHLRTLLHRNDTMGMRASIEARFPFLDETLVKHAINMPTRFKLRFAPDVWEKEHPFVRDKWVIRKVADRYLPRSLSRRRKLGFVVSAFQRMKVAKEFFNGAFVTDHFKLSEREFSHMFEAGDRRLENKLMMLELWGQLFIQGVAPEQMQAHLRRHASFG